MGLLDDLLGGLAGQGMGGRAQQQPARAGAGGAGMSSVLVALMPVVLGMLSNRGRQIGAPNQMNVGPGAGGGLADVLGQVLGGQRGAAARRVGSVVCSSSYSTRASASRPTRGCPAARTSRSRRMR